MDILRSIVKAMKSQEKKEFRKFIHSQKRLEKRKDLELFDLLTNDIEDDKLEEALYGYPNKTAYHAVRKRLTGKLTDFIVLKRLEGDTTSSTSLMGMIALARYFFERRAIELGWMFLKNAERRAEDTEQYDLLNTVYLMQIEHWLPESGEDIHAIIEKRHANKRLLDEDERATIASSLIKIELQKTIKESKEVDFEGITKLILSSYQLTNALAQRPKILYNILSIARSTILAKKDFYSFEPYLIDQYQLAKSKFGFTRNTHFYKLSLLYMIVHVLYRNRKFDQAANYLEEMKEGLYAYDSSHEMLFYPRYTLLSAAVQCYQGKLQEAILTLKKVNDEQAEMFSVEDDIKLQLNLSIYYFMAEDYDAALRTGRSFEHTEKWMEKNIGREWVFKKQLMEVIVQVDLGHDDIALNKIRSMERSSSAMFNHPLYARAKPFLDVIKKMLNDPINFGDETTLKKIEKNLIVVPEEKEDLQAMTFYAWLKAKYLRRNFYEVLLETIRPS